METKLRVFCHLLVVGCLLMVCTGLHAQDNAITVKADRVAVKDILKSISEQSEYKFVYNSNLVDVGGKVSVDISSSSVEEILDVVLEGTSIGYSIVGKQVALFRKNSEQQPSVPSSSSSHRVQGTVVDAEGEPLIGADVFIQGTNIGTFTDLDGKYSLEIPSRKDVVLVFRFAGMLEETASAGNRQTLDMVMTEDRTMLESSVVTGYQTLSRERSAGSFARVAGAEVKNRANVQGSPLKGLEGSVAGLNVNTTASGTSYLIRGTTSINAKTEPLYIVDGVPMERSMLERMVNPNDIENVTFLKDATAASIWGAQAANGVVVFTTKTGAGKSGLSVSYNGSFSYKGLPDYSYQDRMTSRDFINTAVELFDPNTYTWSDISSTIYGSSFTYPIVLPHEEVLYGYFLGKMSADEKNARLEELSSIDGRSSYEKAFMSRSFLTNHSLSFSGSNDSSNFYVSFEYQKNNGTSKDTQDEFKTYMRDILKISDHVKLDLSLNALYSRGLSHSLGSNEFWSYGVDLPYMTYFNADGSYRDIIGFVLGDSIREKVEKGSGIDMSFLQAKDYIDSQDKTDSYSVRANMGLEINLFPWLKYELRGQYSFSSRTSEQFYPADVFSVRVERAFATDENGVQYLPSSGGHFSVTNGGSKSYTVRNQLNLNKDFSSSQITGVAGFEINSTKNTSYNTFLRGYDIQTMEYIMYDQYELYTTGVRKPLLPMIGGATANEFEPNSYRQSETEYRFVSAYANAAYTYAGKYSLNASIRVDQSNLFGSDPSVQFKPIWSVGGIWNLKKEKFMDSVQLFDQLNLRLSYGLAGNSPNPGEGGPYNIIASASDPSYSRFGLGYSIATPANDKLIWEKTRTINLGIDYSILAGRISGSLDVYHKKTTDLLSQMPVDPSTGFKTVLSNIGVMTNRGFELSLNTVNVLKRTFSWDTNFNISYNVNRLDEMYIVPPGTPSSLVTYQHWEGYPVGTIFAYDWAGLDHEKGMPRVYDADGSIVNKVSAISGTDAVKYRGTTIPPLFGSLRNSLKYKNLELSFMFVYNMGHVLRNDINSQYSYRLTGSLHNDFAKRWKEPGDEAKTDIPAYYKLSDTSINESDVISLYRYADINVLPAAYIKLRELSLSYNVPAKLCRSLGTQSINIGFLMNDLLTIAFNGQGIDPEAFSLSYGSRGEKFRPYASANINIEF